MAIQTGWAKDSSFIFHQAFTISDGRLPGTRAVKMMSIFLLRMLLLLVVGSGLFLQAQTDQGTITGVVQDGGGALNPNAVVTLKSTDNGLALERRTDSSGVYVFSPIKIGLYSLTATAPGFQTTNQENIRVDIQQRLEVNIKLSVGSVTETVQVLNLLATYTYSHSLDDAPTQLGSNGDGGFRNANLVGIGADYSNSPWDTRHRVTFNGTYELPFGQGKTYLNKGNALNYLAGGWSSTLVFRGADRPAIHRQRQQLSRERRGLPRDPDTRSFPAGRQSRSEQCGYYLPDQGAHGGQLLQPVRLRQPAERQSDHGQPADHGGCRAGVPGGQEKPGVWSGL